MESSFSTYLAEEEELYVLTSSLTDTSLLTSNVNISCVETEDYLSALSKKIIQRYSTIEDKHKRVKSLTAKLCRDITADVLLDRGKKLFLESALKCLKNELEMLSFAIVQRKASVVKLGNSAKARTKIRQKMSSDQKNIDKKMRIFNVLQFVVHGQEETVRLDECSLVDGMFPRTLNGVYLKHIL
ncbi:uncharacterized protein LOC124456384 [Xenia sp. Carnegie-2017]|uniref:uncharacterized protein LOC124456384 n=1 Tax=Xenia sp. Carnegie-2017 TaxID=2897299 RepID=UPI001F0417DF|nr:uncharacterized protein LOC124456384 [Xenia sp. Carnegie-2017]